MAEYLKTGLSESEKAEENAKVRAIVEATLADIEARGDAAVAEMSKKFDNWERPTFRLSEAEIEACLARMSAQNITDIKFAQEQVRNVAKIQRDALRPLI